MDSFEGIKLMNYLIQISNEKESFIQIIYIIYFIFYFIIIILYTVKLKKILNYNVFKNKMDLSLHNFKLEAL